MRYVRQVLAILVAAAFLAQGSPAHAGFADAMKKKVAEKAAQAARAKPATGADAEKPATAAGGDAPSGSKGAGSSPVSSVSTKFDFVPGDSVLFMDDFTGDELGEFPSRWRLLEGTFEVAELDGARWARCVSGSGSIRMKVPARLPEFWTLEFDLHNDDLSAIALTVSGVTASGSTAWNARFPYSGQQLSFVTGSVVANTPFPGNAGGRHHVAFMARGDALKVYVDRERMANLPDVAGPGRAVEIDVRLASPSKPLITGVRFAQGCRPAADLLAAGKLVTQAIRFETGSDVVLPESAPILRQVAAWLIAHPEARLRVTGHTDDVGSPAANRDLSKRRAASVARVLGGEFGIGAARFEADGLGDTAPIAKNSGPEGRAMNRRVEFTRL